MSTTTIPLRFRKRIFRLLSAKTDMEQASRAFDRFDAENDDGEREDFFLSMVVSYARPFTESHGIGSLLREYPKFPDFADKDLNLRHKRMIDLRHKFLSHSSLEGTRVQLLAPGVISPFSGKPSDGYGYAVAKLGFSHEPRFVSWLNVVVIKLWERLRDDVNTLLAEVGSKHLKDGDNVILDSSWIKPFEWTR